MRKLVVAASFAILTVPAVAADIATPSETVVVENDSPVGIWKITMPKSFKFAVLGKTEWGPKVDAFCQVEKIRTELTVHCLGLRINSNDVSRGTMSMVGNNIRMVWGSSWTYAALSGTLHSPVQFDGKFSVQHLGISSDDPDEMTGTKLSLSANTPDNTGKSDFLARLLREMAKGALTIPLDKQATNVRILKPDTLRSLGDVQSIIYLGEQDNIRSFYDVEFSNGYLICNLHQGADNTLDQFDCG